MWNLEVEMETIYKTKFYCYKQEYISIDKIDIDTKKVMKKGKLHLFSSELIEESNSAIWNFNNWDKDAFNEYINNSKIFITNLSS